MLKGGVWVVFVWVDAAEANCTYTQNRLHAKYNSIIELLNLLMIWHRRSKICDFGAISINNNKRYLKLIYPYNTYTYIQYLILKIHISNHANSLHLEDCCYAIPTTIAKISRNSVSSFTHLPKQVIFARNKSKHSFKATFFKEEIQKIKFDKTRNNYFKY